MVKLTRTEAKYYRLDTGSLWLLLDQVAVNNTRSGGVSSAYGRIQGRWFALVNHHDGGNPSRIVAELCECRDPKTEHPSDLIDGCDFCDHTGILRDQPPAEPTHARREQLIQALRPKASS